jgi:hypothetical protein
MSNHEKKLVRFLIVAAIAVTYFVVKEKNNNDKED